MSYDDGKLEDRQLISIFNKHGIKGTFHINSGMFAQEIRIKPDEFSTLYKGHEIACHTLTHPTIARCPLSEVIREIGDDRANLEKITHHPVQGLSYPNGSYSKDIEALLPGICMSGRLPAITITGCLSLANSSVRLPRSNISTWCMSGDTAMSSGATITGR